jgi:DNA repair protein RecO (recombination protein O)
MPLLETEAIVLRTYRLGEADKIASLLTRQTGRLRATAAGAQRPKSRYGGTLEPLSYIRLWLFERENRDLLRINSTELIESFFDMQGDYSIHLAGQYVAEAVEKLLPEREVNERAFRLVLAVLRALKRYRELNRPLVYFNYWLLRLGGFLPDLEHCGRCGRPLGEETAFGGTASDSLLCRLCRTASTTLALPPTARAWGSALRHTSLDNWMASGGLPEGCTELRTFLEMLVEHHAERKLVTRELLREECS